MAEWHLRSGRKPTGGFLNKLRKKRRSDRGSKFLETKIGEKRLKLKRTKGGGAKARLLADNSVNVSDNKGRIVKMKILSVADNPSNPNYVRRNVLTKGAVVKTDLGTVKITSRPSQDGVINGVLVEMKK